VHDGGRTVSIAAIIAFAATTEFASNRVAPLPDELLECGDHLSVVGRDDSY
jgi:K+/H+ antiporter YhaU regulatory subunit KhtT